MIDEKQVNQDPNSPLIYLKDYGLINIKKVVRVGELHQHKKFYPASPDGENWYYYLIIDSKSEDSLDIYVPQEELARPNLIEKWVKFI